MPPAPSGWIRRGSMRRLGWPRSLSGLGSGPRWAGRFAERCVAMLTHRDALVQQRYAGAAPAILLPRR